MTSGAAPGGEIRRILVALDASLASRSALEAAARLAAALHAELRGVFVEDVNLLRLPHLPFAREVDALSREVRRVDREGVERQLLRQRRIARGSLRAVAERAEVRWSFRSTRGAVTREVRREAEDADLVTLGTRGWFPGRGPGSTVLGLLRDSPLPTLLLPRGAELGPTVYALHDGSEGGGRCVATAAELARAGGLELTVLLSAPGGDAERLERALTEGLAGSGLRPRFRRLPAGIDLAALSSLIRAGECGLLAVPRPRDDPEPARRLLASIRCPVLLV